MQGGGVERDAGTGVKGKGREGKMHMQGRRMRLREWSCDGEISCVDVRVGGWWFGG
jgi:hypothetical protein